MLILNAKFITRIIEVKLQLQLKTSTKSIKKLHLSFVFHLAHILLNYTKSLK